MLETVKSAFTKAYGRAPEVVSAAPGRLEFIGNHTDYNGGLVMGVTIDRYIHCAAAWNQDGKIRLISEGPVVEVPWPTMPRQDGSKSWSNYPLGVLHSLLQEGVQLPRGLDFAFTTTLPVGAGLSSSAAMELATARAVLALTGHHLSDKRLVLACQRAENEFVGVPCGILDQAVSCYGSRDHLVFIDCAVIEMRSFPVPAGIHFWVFNTNKKHSLVDSLYSTRNRECQDAFKLLREVYPASNLSEIKPEQVEAQRKRLPENLYKRAKHVVEENVRVQRMQQAMRMNDLTEAGRLLLASHESSRTLFENSIPELDALVEIVSAEPHVYGARLSGGGFGGAVMAMTSPQFTPVQAEKVIYQYRKRLPQAPAPTVLEAQTGEGARIIETQARA